VGKKKEKKTKSNGKILARLSRGRKRGKKKKEGKLGCGNKKKGKNIEQIQKKKENKTKKKGLVTKE
jgi:hypothetical protein